MTDLGALGDVKRISAYARIAVVGYALTFVLLVALSPGLADPSGKPVGYDFMAFWSAARLTLAGTPQAAFDPDAISAVARAAVPGSTRVYLWHYPPTFQLVTAPLGLLPYFAAYIVFAAASLVVFVKALSPWVPWQNRATLLLAFPGTFICSLHGQNALITAALLTTSVRLIDRRPVLAGICIGLLAYKPQFGILFPFVLLAAGRWRAIAAAASTMLLYVAISTLVFGPDLWLAFFKNLSFARSLMENAHFPWSKMPSAFVFLRKFGVGENIAYTVQAAVALSVIVSVALLWRRTGATAMSGVAFIAGTLLICPYVYDYEFAVLAGPIALLAQDMIARATTQIGRPLLGVLFAFPAVMTFVAQHTNFQPGFLIVLLAFLTCWRRAWAPPPARPVASLAANADFAVSDPHRNHGGQREILPA